MAKLHQPAAVSKFATPREQELIDKIAEAGFKPGDYVVVSRFAAALGIKKNPCIDMANRLREKGLWPYRHGSNANRDRLQEVNEKAVRKFEVELIAKEHEWKWRAKLIRDAKTILGRQLEHKELDVLLSVGLNEFLRRTRRQNKVNRVV